MINPGSIARRGYLETVLAIAVDGYLGSRGGDNPFVSDFIGDFTGDFIGDFVSSYLSTDND